MNIRDRMRTVLFILFLFIFSVPGYSQSGESAIALAFIGIRSEPDIKPEAEIIENKLISAITEAAQKIDFIIIIPENRDELLKEMEFAQSDAAKDGKRIEAGNLLSADGIISGELIGRNERMYLSIHLVKTESGETIMAEFKDAASFADLLADAGRIVNRLFDLEKSPGHNVTVTPDMVSGEWKGDKGIDSVYIDSNGWGKAYFNSWNSMRIRVTIEGNSCVIEQAEPNAPKMYTTIFSYTVALQASDLARPMKWIFELSEDLQTLTGEKYTSYFEIENNRIISVDNEYKRPAVWERRR